MTRHFLVAICLTISAATAVIAEDDAASASGFPDSSVELFNRLRGVRTARTQVLPRQDETEHYPTDYMDVDDDAERDTADVELIEQSAVPAEASTADVPPVTDQSNGTIPMERAIRDPMPDCGCGPSAGNTAPSFVESECPCEPVNAGCSLGNSQGTCACGGRHGCSACIPRGGGCCHTRHAGCHLRPSCTSNCPGCTLFPSICRSPGCCR